LNWKLAFCSVLLGSLAPECVGQMVYDDTVENREIIQTIIQRPYIPSPASRGVVPLPEMTVDPGVLSMITNFQPYLVNLLVSSRTPDFLYLSLKRDQASDAPTNAAWLLSVLGSRVDALLPTFAMPVVVVMACSSYKMADAARVVNQAVKYLAQLASTEGGEGNPVVYLLHCMLPRHRRPPGDVCYWNGDKAPLKWALSALLLAAKHSEDAPPNRVVTDSRLAWHLADLPLWEDLAELVLDAVRILVEEEEDPEWVGAWIHFLYHQQLRLRTPPGQVEVPMWSAQFLPPGTDLPAQPLRVATTTEVACIISAALFERGRLVQQILGEESVKPIVFSMVERCLSEQTSLGESMECLVGVCGILSGLSDGEKKHAEAMRGSLGGLSRVFVEHFGVSRDMNVGKYLEQMPKPLSPFRSRMLATSASAPVALCAVEHLTSSDAMWAIVAARGAPCHSVIGALFRLQASGEDIARGMKALGSRTLRRILYRLERTRPALNPCLTDMLDKVIPLLHGTDSGKRPAPVRSVTMDLSSKEPLPTESREVMMAKLSPDFTLREPSLPASHLDQVPLVGCWKLLSTEISKICGSSAWKDTFGLQRLLKKIGGMVLSSGHTPTTLSLFSDLLVQCEQAQDVHPGAAVLLLDMFERMAMVFSPRDAARMRACNGKLHPESARRLFAILAHHLPPRCVVKGIEQALARIGSTTGATRVEKDGLGSLLLSWDAVEAAIRTRMYHDQGWAVHVASLHPGTPLRPAVTLSNGVVLPGGVILPDCQRTKYESLLKRSCSSRPGREDERIRLRNVIHHVIYALQIDDLAQLIKAAQGFRWLAGREPTLMLEYAPQWVALLVPYAENFDPKDASGTDCLEQLLFALQPLVPLLYSTPAYSDLLPTFIQLLKAVAKCSTPRVVLLDYCATLIDAKHSLWQKCVDDEAILLIRDGFPGVAHKLDFLGFAKPTDKLVGKVDLSSSAASVVRYLDVCSACLSRRVEGAPSDLMSDSGLAEARKHAKLGLRALGESQLAQRSRAMPYLPLLAECLLAEDDDISQCATSYMKGIIEASPTLAKCVSEALLQLADTGKRVSPSMAQVVAELVPHLPNSDRAAFLSCLMSWLSYPSCSRDIRNTLLDSFELLSLLTPSAELRFH